MTIPLLLLQNNNKNNNTTNNNNNDINNNNDHKHHDISTWLDRPGDANKNNCFCFYLQNINEFFY